MLDLTKEDLQNLTKEIASNLIDRAYPIGAIYMSVNPTNPATLFGGTWERWGNGRVPVGVNESDSDFGNAQKEGGEKVHVLTEGELPNIQGSIRAGSGSDGGVGSNGAFRGASGKFQATIGGIGSWVADSTKTSWGGGAYQSVTMSFGNNQAHNILQPYITCYMWQRTA